MNKIIYLDAAASYLKPEAVISAEVDFLQNKYANAGRGVCARASAVDVMVDAARKSVADFIGTEKDNIVFTAGTTSAMNMIVQLVKLDKNKTVAVSDIDHHSARLPFVNTGACVELCPLDANFNIDANMVPKADVLVVTAMSNVLGIAQDVKGIIEAAKKKNPNVITVVDAAQFVVHGDIDVKKWDCDFMCFSGHKIGADTGLGVMYIKSPDLFKPVMFGGGMVNKIVGDTVVYNNAPDVYEAGTLPLTKIVGLKYAIEELVKNRPEMDLIKFMYDELAQIPKIKLISQRDASLLSFVVDGMHVLDFGALIGARGVCLRVGNMCASWICQRMNLPGVIRISVGGYNSVTDVEIAVKYIKEIVK